VVDSVNHMFPLNPSVIPTGPNGAVKTVEVIGKSVIPGASAPDAEAPPATSKITPTTHKVTAQRADRSTQLTAAPHVAAASDPRQRRAERPESPAARPCVTVDRGKTDTRPA
jgi:hypothetical protein